jgi:hypothetical protein
MASVVWRTRWFYPVIELAQCHLPWLSSSGTAGGRMIQGAIELGALVAFIQYSDTIFPPIADMSEKLQHPAVCDGEFGKGNSRSWTPRSTYRIRKMRLSLRKAGGGY